MGNIKPYCHLIIVFGLPGSGKTYFARRFAETIQAQYISTDSIRKKFLPLPTYTDQEKSSIYQLLFGEIRNKCKPGQRIVVDGTFSNENNREQLKSTMPPGMKPDFIEIHAEEATIKNRLQKPRTDSDADFKVYRKIKSTWPELKEKHLVLESTDENISEMIQLAKTWLKLKDE